MLKLSNFQLFPLLEIKEKSHDLHPLVYHLREGVCSAGELGPATVQTDLKDGPNEPAGRLSHIDHVRHQRKPLQLQLGDVGLE